MTPESHANEAGTRGRMRSPPRQGRRPERNVKIRRPAENSEHDGKTDEARNDEVRASALDNQLVVFDDRVAQQIAADFVELSLGLGAIELQFDELADAGGLHRGQTMMMNGIADRNTLRIKHALFG